jgi:hypothetical protein
MEFLTLEELFGIRGSAALIVAMAKKFKLKYPYPFH